MATLCKYLQFWLFLICCTYLGLTLSPNEVLVQTFSDKFLHAVGYLLLLISGNYAYRPGQQLFLKTAMLFSYSLLIEIAQHFIPNRGFSLGDLAANISGLILGWALLLLYGQIKGRNNRQEP